MEGLPRLVPFSHVHGAVGNVRRGNKDILVENAPYSRVFHGAIIDADSRFLYDVPVTAEPAGAIALPVDQNLRVGLLKQWRPIPARDPSQNDALDVVSGVSCVQRGFWSIEVPRGFPNGREAPIDAARRESEEELGVHVTKAVSLGYCNFNTSVLLSDIPLFAVLAHPTTTSSAGRDKAERISHVHWYNIQEVFELINHGEIRCGLTKASLIHFVASRNKIEEMVKNMNQDYGIE